MKEWLRVLPLPGLVFAVLTILDWYGSPEEINWLLNTAQAVMIGAIGCVGMFLIHKNVLKDDGEDCDGGAGCNCG